MAEEGRSAGEDRNTAESVENKPADNPLVDKYNVEASEILANEALLLPIAEAIPIYEQLLSTFPTAILAILAIPLTMSAGLLFGSFTGTIIVSISGTVVDNGKEDGRVEIAVNDQGYHLVWFTGLAFCSDCNTFAEYVKNEGHPKIIHRDINASNILLDFRFEPKVADFGLAKIASDTNTHVSTRVMGTFGYLAPEYASSGKLIDRSDVFSFGVMLLELITGRRPVDKAYALMDESMVDWARLFFDEGNYSLYRIPSGKKGDGHELLNMGNDKNDYDWLKTPPATPLFPSLEMESTGPELVIQREIQVLQPMNYSRVSQKVAESSADPEEYPNLFEDWQIALAVESNLSQRRFRGKLLTTAMRWMNLFLRGHLLILVSTIFILEK